MEIAALNNILRKNKETKSIFRGTVTMNNLPNLIEKRNIIVIFLANGNKIGHFVLLFLNQSNAVYFDSLANAISPALIDYCRSCGVESIQVSNKRIQGDHSCSCGPFVIYTAIKLASAHRLESVLDRFTDNLNKNDAQIVEWATSKYHFLNKTALLKCQP